MNLKKLLLTLVTIAIFGVFVAVQGVTYAKTLPTGQEVYMGVREFMENSTPAMGYGINIPGNANGARIWNIVRYDSASSTTYHNDNIYCVKAGVGFTEASPNDGESKKRKPYNVSYNMKTEREAIRTHKDKTGTQNTILQGLVEGNITENGATINRYNAILAVLDNLYLPGESTEEEKKELIYTLIKCVNNDSNYSNYTGDIGLMVQAFDGVTNTGDFIVENSPTKYNLTDYALTDNDINAVQQAVLWYFTNYGENDLKYDKTNGEKGWLSYCLPNESTYKSLDNYEPAVINGEQAGKGLARSRQAEVLYNYMIRQAKASASNYADTASTSGTPIKLDTTILKRVEESGDNYVVGPILMTKVNSTPYTIDFRVKNNGSEISNYQLLDENQKAVVAGTTVKDLVGKNFYLSVPKNQLDNLTVDVTVTYNDTTMTLWTSSENDEEQPLVEVERTTPEEKFNLKIEPKPEPEESFDLKLIKRITAVNDQNVPERIEKIDVSKLNIEGANNQTTAEYKLDKEPVGVAKGDIVTYTFRIYNEGTLDGYAEEITEDVPEGLQFIWSEKTGEELKNDTTLTDQEKEAIEFNQKYLWGKFVYDDTKENITQISSDYLSKDNETTAGGNLIKAFGHNDGSKTEKDLSYKELAVKFKVVSENKAGKVIRNEAAISEDADKDGNPVKDRDSDTEKWGKENDDKYYDDNKKWPIYKEDDEDYDNIILQSFDLALRKFIIAISDDTKIENNEYLKNEDGSYTRAPVVDTSKLNTEDETGKLITTATYNHTKEPIIVKPNDIVVYMLRVYNEGDVDGYAAEIKDHLPPYLEYVDDEFNKQYGWEVSEDGRTVTTKHLENSLIKAAEAHEKAGANYDEDGNIIGVGGAISTEYKLYYQEVPIMCKVSENAKTSENITNIADITKYLDKNKNSVADRDSQENNVKLPEDKDLPSYKENEKGSYVPGQQDDDDFEKVNVKIFDLALRKWVTQAIVIENGKQTVTQTGHDAWDDPEQVVKVELHRKKLNQVTVKFRYSIRVYNQGEIEGYAKEVTDYIPEGLKFVAEDNPGWTDEGNNVISTRLLENTLLQPGEYADVEVLLTWINNENNMGVMNNTAEISEDYNKYGVPDIDSTPDNKKAGEDDIDDAPVMLSISTGQMRIYFTLGFIVLITTASGVILIKKFVL